MPYVNNMAFVSAISDHISLDKEKFERKFVIIFLFISLIICLGCSNEPWERIGPVVECLTRDRRAVGWSLTGVTALWSLSKTHLSQLSTGSTQEDPSLFN